MQICNSSGNSAIKLKSINGKYSANLFQMTGEKYVSGTEKKFHRIQNEKKILITIRSDHLKTKYTRDKRNYFPWKLL